MDKNGLYLETISTGNRIDASYDIWVKYIKPTELIKYPVIMPGDTYIPPVIEEPSNPDDGTGDTTIIINSDHTATPIPSNIIEESVEDAFNS